MQRKRNLLMICALLLALVSLPCWAQNENPPATQAGKTSDHGMTAGEQTPDDNSSSTRDQIKALQQQLDDALIKGDVSTLERLYSEDYVSQSASSGNNNKKQLLEAIRNGDVKFETIQNQDGQVRVYGNTAVATGTTKVKGHSKAKGDINAEQQFTRVWVKRNGQWQSVSFQSTPVEDTQSATKEH